MGLLALALAAPALLLDSAPALATFHEVSIREVYAGSSAVPGSQYVELQMWSPGQNLVGGRSIQTYGPSGASTGTATFPVDVTGAANQSTLLLGTAAVETQFGVVPDAPMSPGQLDPAGGAVCWAESIDCVSWGAFSGSSLPGPAAPPAAPAGIPDGMALRRAIAPGCPTLLEPTDDRDSSAADFAAVFPAPRPNSVAPAEHSCAAGGGQSGTPSGGQGDRGAPRTLLRGKPPHRTGDRTPTFRFASDEAGSTFQCKLDGRPYRRCHSPYTTARLALGRHTFRVRARDGSGKLDPSPATYRFEVVRRRRSA